MKKCILTRQECQKKLQQEKIRSLVQKSRFFEVYEKVMLNNNLCLKLITAEKRNAVIVQQSCNTKQMSFFLAVHEI